MKLSRNFNLQEFTFSGTLGRHIEPLPIQIKRITRLAVYVLQPVRDQWGRLMITGGIRNSEIHEALFKKATEDRENGKWTPFPVQYSDHFAGDPVCPRGTGAADFTSLDADIRDVFYWIVSQTLPYKKVIFYPEQLFIHISNPYKDDPPLREAKVYVHGEYHSFDSKKEIRT